MTKPKRLEHPLNAELFKVIPVMYGAVLSYAMYIFASLIVSLFKHYDSSQTRDVGVSLSEFLALTFLFLAFVFFVVEDLGEIVKLDRKFPFKRTSRYSHEIIISCMFLVTFALVDAKSVLAIFVFGLAIFWGGIWCNQLKEEYINDNSRIAELAKTQRVLQYVGGTLFRAKVESGVRPPASMS